MTGKVSQDQINMELKKQQSREEKKCMRGI